MTICDNCSSSVEPTANYCPECGSELDPPLKDWADGFLTLVDRGHIQEAIDGNETLPNRYHERLHETVRHALADFCLLDRWEEFDNEEALFGDLPDEDIDVDDIDAVEKLVRLTCPFRFVLNGAGLERLENIVAVSVYLCSSEPEITPDDVSVTIEVGGEEE
ncbi:zinc ribbon domain-containing protein [Natrinema salsiterrestre]|uniref:Zinc ribbon domain-containing protein n=1 Tax=Natrinema salsiterrestre TaxID=2950540 RepID=A0A9Q4Q3L3_9EURY|nr:zinc ribbon domain-containing protein [Natrinema salsiterrestre]MDF9746297.1 zinc ribbon domain-containing protein [Natrinema salsiterrestre]